VEVANILDKKFYVVVPYSSFGDNTKSGFAGLFSKKKQENTAFEKAREQLMQRSDLLSSQLSGIGIKAKPLTTREVAQLFYDIYNPSTAMGEKMEHNIDPYTSMYVTQGSKADQEQSMEVDTPGD
jgi:hypothetical protein